MNEQRLALEGIRNIVEPADGMKAYTTPRGIRVIELHWWAHPQHDSNWMKEERKRYSSKDWRREMELDWSTPAGDAFFPEFAEVGGKDVFVYMATRMMKGAVVRSFDFGRRRPACTWFQYSPKSDRVWVYREFMPHDIGTHEFRDAVRHLSGELMYHELPDKAKLWVDAYAAKPSGAHCPPPWFPPGTRFVNIGGKEANQQQSNAFLQEDAVAANIFAAGDIPLTIISPSVEGRNDIIRRLLRRYDDGYPGLLIDPQCEELVEMFEGGLSYPLPTEKVPIPTKPKDDGHYLNLLDAFGYGIAAVVPEDTPRAPRPKQFLGYRGREPMYSTPEEVIPWAENRRGRR